jgi:hypothetical protein
MKNILLLFLVVISPGLLAQQVVSSAGSSMSNASGSISYTIGEGVSQTISNGDKTLTQGFHQTTLSVSSINEIKDLDFTISVYPNPTNDFVNLLVGKDEVLGFKYQLFDINGKLISQKELEGNETKVSFQHLSSGFYLLRVNNGSQELKSFKIIKQ